MDINKKPIYPVEAWDITENKFSMETNYRNETTFALSNGYIGTRGTFEEGYDFSVDEGLEGNFINGFYESVDIPYGEWNFGFPTKSQSLLNLPDLKKTEIYADGELFDMRTGKVEEYSRVLHMKDGYVQRNLIWTSPSGKKLKLVMKRFVSLVHKKRMYQQIQITPVNFSGEIKIRSYLNGNVENHTRKTNPLIGYGPFGSRLHMEKLLAGDGVLYYEGTTLQSGMTVGCGSRYNIKVSEEGNVPEVVTVFAADKEEIQAVCESTVETEENTTVTCEKFIVYTSSQDMEAKKLETFAREELEKAANEGWQAEFHRHCEKVHDFWDVSDVQIYDDEALQQGIRFNLFHIMQSAGRDGRTGMGAKGLSGEGYEGHYFWDTEMYVLPVFIYTAPELARKLLEYRFGTLDQARDRAKVLGHPKGALYPWRTINGEEASTYFPLGTAQYHINADIAYAFWLYVSVTGDMEFFRDMAAEVLVETARVWADVGYFAECKGGKYCICAVTGPDEYNAVTDNNFYTNLMGRENIRYALKTLEMLKQEPNGVYEEFVSRMGITEEETSYWEKIVENMYFPYDENRQVYALDDRFMMLRPWDDSRIPPEKRHLLYENYHPLFVYRQRMCKQADAIFGLYLHSNFFTKEELKRNYDFYQEVTLHHSSLSNCVFGMLACQIGYYEEAYEYFSQSARMDLDDYHDNFYAGIHAANMGGTWLAIVNGFAGVRVNGGELELHPFVPKQWKGMQFHILYRGRKLKIQLSHEKTRVELVSGDAVSLWINEKEVHLDGGKETVYEEEI